MKVVKQAQLEAMKALVSELPKLMAKGKEAPIEARNELDKDVTQGLEKEGKGVVKVIKGKGVIVIISDDGEAPIDFLYQ